MLSVLSAPKTSSRGAYTALTPEYVDFSIPHRDTSITSPDISTIPGTSWENQTVAGRRYSCLSGLARVGREIYESNTGLLLVAASQACLAVVNVTVKSLNSMDSPVSTLEIIWVRMFITALCSVGVMFLTHVPDPILGPKGVRLLLWLRGFLGFVALYGVYYSLESLSLSDATVLTFLAPMCTAIAGSWLLGEIFTRREAIAGAVSLVGVVLIARPTSLFGGSGAVGSGETATAGQRLLAVGVALIGVLGVTGASPDITIRAIGTRAHALHSLSFFSIQSVIISTVGMIVTKTPIIVPTRLLWLGCMGIIGSVGFIGQLFLTMGLQRETAGRATIALYSQIVFAIVLEQLIFQTVPGMLSIIGTLFILGSALYVAITKEREKTPDSMYLQQMDGELEAGLLDHMEAEEDISPSEGKPMRQEPSSHAAVSLQELSDSRT